MSKAIAKGDVVRPAGDGEDWAGRVLQNTKARLRVTAAWERHDGPMNDLVVIRPGGIWQRGGRMQSNPAGSFVKVDDIK